MTIRSTGVVIALCVLAASAWPGEAQIGGFLKKKAKEAAQAPVKQQEAQQQSDEAAARALSAPDVVPITEESTARFLKALGVEIRLRDEFRSFLASLKTRQQYDECRTEVMMSPEGQKAAMAMLSLGDKATPAEMQKVMQKAGEEVEALTVKRCGGDPAAWTDAKRRDRLEEIEGEASDSFAPSGETPPKGSAPAAPHPHRRKYAIAKERWIPGCLAEAAKTDGKYRKIKGQGEGVYVFTVEEAQVLSEHCPEVMAKLNKVTEPVQSAK